jgi:hypothetical protein
VSAIEVFARDRWIRMTVAAWVVISLVLIIARWHQIAHLHLSDTDDNLRLAQVRDWLAGQGWFDLRQYRLNPPAGFNIHWSRIVDLPLAGLMLLGRPLLGVAGAERLAVAVAPLLPLGLVMLSLASIARRLVAPMAYPIALAFLMLAPFAMGAFAPTRIDHHSWQLAAISLLGFALSGKPSRRYGMLAGFATGLSLSIGLEMLPFLLIGGAIITLAWVLDPDRQRQLRWFAVSLLLTAAAGYFGFASQANRLPLCDALTPVWLSAVIDSALMLFMLSWLRSGSVSVRLAAVVIAGAVVAGLYVYSWPHCLSRLEGASPELQRLWLDNVTEARPVMQQDSASAIAMGCMPIMGLAGYGWMLFTARGVRADIIRLLPFALLASVGAALLLFQVRITPTAQILAVPGVTFAAWQILPKLRSSRAMFVRVFGTLAVLILPSGMLFSLLAKQAEPGIANATPSAKAFASCDDAAAFAALNSFPSTTVLTFIDLGPRLIVTTHHSAIAGPYHRNGGAILDVFHAFGGTADAAQTIARRHGAGLVLICPSLAEGGQYLSRNPGGFYAQLKSGHPPAWLKPVALPQSSPFKLWQVKP